MSERTQAGVDFRAQRELVDDVGVVLATLNLLVEASLWIAIATRTPETPGFWRRVAAACRLRALPHQIEDSALRRALCIRLPRCVGARQRPGCRGSLRRLVTTEVVKHPSWGLRRWAADVVRRIPKKNIETRRTIYGKLKPR